MKLLPWYVLFALMFLSAQNAQASHLVFKWGFEKVIFQEGMNAERVYGLEYLHPIGPTKSMHLKAEGGHWFARQEGRVSSPYVSLQWGYRVHMESGLYFEAFVGPGYVWKLDTQLSSKGEIFHDVNAGFLDKDGWGLGLGFKHISNAGIVPPNRGRDFLPTVRFMFPL